MNMTKQKLFVLVAGTLAVWAQSAIAAVTAEEAKQLGTTLTEFGAEKGGNKDGSIPAYTGGVETVAGFDRKSGHYVDPFKSDKVLYSVNATSMKQYDALLTAGTKAMMAANPEFRIDVYPTRRSMRYTKEVLQNTVKNATTAKLGGAVEGDSLEGADKGNLPFAGIPFPIPKTGLEMMWNNHLRFSAAVVHEKTSAYMVDASGNASPLPTPDQYFMHPWYDVKGTLRPKTFDSYFGFSSLMTSPPSSAGIVFLNYYLPNKSDGGQKVWFYTPGQRRVRLAPEFAYDVPIASYGGVVMWDELYGFVGRLDRFDFKLVGKKEMLVPYNMYYLLNDSLAKDSVGSKFINPSAMRWEKHRVWVVDALRKTNSRHAYSRRTFYVDEDCLCIVANEGYDNAGKVWRTTFVHSMPTYDTGGIFMNSFSTYDLVKGNYFMLNSHHREFPDAGIWAYDTAEGLPINLTPQAVAAGSLR